MTVYRTSSACIIEYMESNWCLAGQWTCKEDGKTHLDHCGPWPRGRVTCKVDVGSGGEKRRDKIVNEVNMSERSYEVLDGEF